MESATEAFYIGGVVSLMLSGPLALLTYSISIELT